MRGKTSVSIRYGEDQTRYWGMNLILLIGVISFATQALWLVSVMWSWALFSQWSNETTAAIVVTGLVWLIASVVTFFVGASKQRWFD